MKITKLTSLPSPRFIAEANALCEEISLGMKGLDREHSYTNEELILAILRIRAREFSEFK